MVMMMIVVMGVVVGGGGGGQKSEGGLLQFLPLEGRAGCLLEGWVKVKFAL